MKKQFLLSCSLFCLMAGVASAQFKILLNFNDTNGAYPWYGDLKLSGSKLFGITSESSLQDGNIFTIDTLGNNFKNLFNFNGVDGKDPRGSLTLSGSKLFGMTLEGGPHALGNIFSIDTDGNNYKVILYFNGTNGEAPFGSLILSGSKLFGMTAYGGANDDGLVFSIDTDGTHYKDVFDFNGVNGKEPYGSLTLSGKKLYGATVYGGIYSLGNIFSIDTNGSNYKDMVDFNGANGEYPDVGNLALYGNKLYGMTNTGGLNNEGLIFSIDTTGSNYKDMLDFNFANGAYPTGTLTPLGNKLFGMTDGGGLGVGCIFSIDTDDSHYKNLINFGANNVPAVQPRGSLTISGNTLYGMTFVGQATAYGTVFSLYYPFSATLNAIPISCNGSNNGQLSAYPWEGTPPYTYKWAPGGQTTDTISGLSAGTYSVTVTDSANLITKASIVITQPLVLAATIAANNILCNGGMGSATVSTSGGISPYTYLWSPSGGTNATGTGLTPGSYKVSITDIHGCTATATVTITQPLALTATMGIPANPSCNGGTGNATVRAGGGTSPYNYSWAPSGGTNAMATGLTAGNYTVTVKDMNDCIATANVLITQPLALTAANGTQTNILCNGGTSSLTITASGGISPYAYLWSPSGGTNATGTGLTAGAYTVTITDMNSCTATAGVVITQPTAVTATMGRPTDILCNGGTGSVMVTPEGGISPYSYSWSPSGGTNATGTGLTAGAYTVTITDLNSCTATASVIITEPTALAATMGVPTNALCNGGTGGVTVSASGGTSPYVYSWSPSGGSNAMGTGLTAGAYTVTITDLNSCTATASATITQPAVLTATMGTPINILCNGGTGSATISASGGTSPYAYSWAPSGGNNAMGTGLTAGAYIVTVRDNNDCSNTASVTITQPTAMVIKKDSINVDGVGACNGEASVKISGGTAPYIYIWSPGGGTNDTINEKCAGQYCCTITDNNGCKENTCITIVNATGINDVIPISKQITLFPNPSNGKFTLAFSHPELVSGTQTIEIYNVLGAKVYNAMLKQVQHDYEINLSNQPNGVYLYRVVSENGDLAGDGKIIIQK